MDIKEIQKLIENLHLRVQEALTTSELEDLMTKIAFWQRKLQEAVKREYCK